MSEATDIYRTQLESASEYDVALAETLCEILGRGMHDLPAIVEGLRTSALASPDGGEWTETQFLAEIKRLGVGPITGPAPAPRL